MLGIRLEYCLEYVEYAGTWVEYAWNMFVNALKLCLEYAYNMLGICLEFACNMLENERNRDGIWESFFGRACNSLAPKPG